MNRSWHTSAFYRPNCWQLPNTALNTYYSSRLFSSIKTKSRFKRSQSDASMHPNMNFRVQNVCYVHYEQTLSTAIHHTSKVSLLPENVKPWCDLPKQNTFPLLLLYLLHWNSNTATTSNQHKAVLQTHRPTLSLSQFANTKDYYLYRMEYPW